MGRWQAIFSQESWRISRKNCAVQGAKDPLIGYVDIFQTSPSLPLLFLVLVRSGGHALDELLHAVPALKCHDRVGMPIPYIGMNFPRDFTQAAILIATCLGESYHTDKLVVYEYIEKMQG